MKLDFEFKQGDCVRCKGLKYDQVLSILERMVECGASAYEGIDSCYEPYVFLTWRNKGDTYFKSSANNATRVLNWDDIKPKSTEWDGEGLPPNLAPEFEDCRKAAETHRIPLKEVYAAAISAYMNQNRK